MKAVLATSNQKKLRELREIVGGMGLELLLPSDMGLSLAVPECGATFEENAAQKANAYRDATGQIAIADDSGLMVDALGGAPGLYSARYGGEGALLDDAGRVRLLLQNMEGKTNRACRFVCAICCAFPNGDRITVRGECAGLLGTEPRGTGGFGYDPIFYLPETGCTMAELSSTEKHRISHRGKALRAFQEELENYLHGNHR
jgi:XTP/dITP diphosphohydrolase